MSDKYYIKLIRCGYIKKDNTYDIFFNKYNEISVLSKRSIVFNDFEINFYLNSKNFIEKLAITNANKKLSPKDVVLFNEVKAPTPYVLSRDNKNGEVSVYINYKNDVKDEEIQYPTQTIDDKIVGNVTCRFSNEGYIKELVFSYKALQKDFFNEMEEISLKKLEIIKKIFNLIHKAYGIKYYSESGSKELEDIKCDFSLLDEDLNFSLPDNYYTKETDANKINKLKVNFIEVKNKVENYQPVDNFEFAEKESFLKRIIKTLDVCDLMVVLSKEAE
jgi:hypothetical protein